MKSFRLLERQARTWPAEHSVALRASAAGAVCSAMAACAAQGEVPGWLAAAGGALVCAGGVFSHRRRSRPLPYLKVALSAAMLGAFVWFFVTVSSDAASGRLTAVETPLAVLFSAMQAAHAFDMPSRRDLGFSLAGSATLMAVAGAQAIDLSFGLFVALWAGFGLAGLHASWSSMAGGRAPRPLSAFAATAGALLVAAMLVAFLPATRPPGLSFAPTGASAGASATGQPARVVPAPRPAHPFAASASGPTGVGGFLGFSGPLDTALRPQLGNEVVLRVRADRPSYWVAETYDSWSGRSWSRKGPTPATRGGRPPGGGVDRGAVLAGGSPFLLAPGLAVPGPARSTGPQSGEPSAAPDRGVAPEPDYQTFYLAAPASDVVLHADRATAVWIPAPRLYVGADGSIRTGEALGAGTVYNVLSTVATPTDAALATANGTAGLTAALVHEDLQLPHPYPRIAALARRVTGRHPTVVSKIDALERWIGAHTRYTLDIPALAPGADAVDQFLFGTRRGFCEQISTSLAVMLRTLGIPAREAVGYVPGRFDPITGLYDEQAKDAHAWVQVWFPGYGWQSFDPTAFVPAQNPSPGSTIGHDVAAALRHVPLTPIAATSGVLALVIALLAVRRRRSRPWSQKVTRELERAARRAGIPADRGETLGSIADALDEVLGRVPGGVPEPGARELASVAARAAWGGAAGDERHGPGRDYLRTARRIRRTARRHARRRARRRSPEAPARGDLSSPVGRAGQLADARCCRASAKVAPATRSGRKAMSWRGRDTASTPLSRPRRP